MRAFLQNDPLRASSEHYAQSSGAESLGAFGRLTACAKHVQVLSFSEKELVDRWVACCMLGLNLRTLGWNCMLGCCFSDVDPVAAGCLTPYLLHNPPSLTTSMHACIHNRTQLHTRHRFNTFSALQPGILRVYEQLLEPGGTVLHTQSLPPGLQVCV